MYQQTFRNARTPQNNFVSPYIQIKLQGVVGWLLKIFRFIYRTSSVCNISISDDLPMNWRSCISIIASVDKVFTGNWYNIAIQLHRKKIHMLAKLTGNAFLNTSNSKEPIT